MASFSQMTRCNVHVYEKSRSSGGFKRISMFDIPNSSKTVHVLYCGGVHYDALIPTGKLQRMPSPRLQGHGGPKGSMFKGQRLPSPGSFMGGRKAPDGLQHKHHWASKHKKKHGHRKF